MNPRFDPRLACFFLGGRDLEMQTIAALLRNHVAPARIFDFGLRWGAKASAYAPEIEHAASSLLVPVLIELTPDIPLPREAVLVDHHGPSAGHEQPTSLEQVFALLDLSPEKWTRRHALVAANDRGYVPEMSALGATRDEIREIRAADRLAQGVTAEQEAAAERAVAQPRHLQGGHLTVIDLPHANTSAVADRMEPLLGGPGYDNLLINHSEGVAFYGEGVWINRLRERFRDGWYGGALPRRGYWGSRRSAGEVLAFLESCFTEPPGAG
jgi:hypothetical protein